MVVVIMIVHPKTFIHVTLVIINVTKMESALSLVTVMTANVKMDIKVTAKNAKTLMNVKKSFMTVIVMRIVIIMMAAIHVLVLMDIKVMDSIVPKLKAMMQVWEHANQEITVVM